MEQNKARYGAIWGRSRCAEFAVVEASAAACGYVVARARAKAHQRTALGRHEWLHAWHFRSILVC